MLVSRAHKFTPADRRRCKVRKLSNRSAFFAAYSQLTQRISIFVNLPLTDLDCLALQTRLDEIGRIGHEEPVA